MTQQTTTDPRDEFIKRFRLRFYKGLDYLVLFVYVAIVSIGALVADYLILFAIECTVATSVSKYPIVSQAFDWFQIGSAFLIFVAAATHAFFSAYSQLKFEVETAKEPTSPKAKHPSRLRRYVQRKKHEDQVSGVTKSNPPS